MSKESALELIMCVVLGTGFAVVADDCIEVSESQNAVNYEWERAFMARCLSDGRSAFECEALCRELDRGGKGCL